MISLGDHCSLYLFHGRRFFVFWTILVFSSTVAYNYIYNGDGSFDRTVMVSEIYKRYKQNMNKIKK